VATVQLGQLHHDRVVGTCWVSAVRSLGSLLRIRHLARSGRRRGPGDIAAQPLHDTAEAFTARGAQSKPTGYTN
jgi:hypothetical protein